VYIVYDQSTQKEQLSFKDSIDMNTAKKNTAKNVSSKVTTTSSSAPITSAKVTRSVKRPSAAPTKPDQTITKTSIRKSVAKKTTPEKKIAKKSTLTTLTKPTLNLEEVNHQKSKPKASPSKKVLKAKQTKEIIKVAEKPKKNKGIKKRERQSLRRTERMFDPLPPPAYDPFTHSYVSIEELQDDEPQMTGGSSASNAPPNMVINVDEDDGSQTDFSDITGDILIGGS